MQMMNNKVAFDNIENLIFPDTCNPLKLAAKNGEIELNAIGRGNYPGGKLKREDLSGIRSIGYWDAKREQRFGLPFHRNEGIEFTLCEAGNITFHCENKKVNLSPNMMAITRPWQPHKLGNPNIEISRLHWIILDVGVRRPHQDWIWPEWIILDKKDLNGLTKLLRENEMPVYHGNSDTVSTFREITSKIQEYGNPGTSSGLKLLVNELLLNFYTQMLEQKQTLNRDLISTERNMELFFAELPNMVQYNWNSQNMAEYCRLKSTRFIYYCNKLTNMSPIQYLHFIRVQKAKTLLIESHNTITEIAFECGFSSSQYFYRIFKKYTDLGPQEFRKKHKKN